MVIFEGKKVRRGTNTWRIYPFFVAALTKLGLPGWRYW